MTKHVAMFVGDLPQPFSPEAMLRVCTSLVWDQRYAEAEAVLDLMIAQCMPLQSARADRRFGELLGMRSMLMAFVNSAEHRRRDRRVRRAA